MENLNKLRWQCRRGTLELDIWFENFLQYAYLGADQAEQAAFCRLLTMEDKDLLSLLMGEAKLESAQMQTLVDKMRSLTNDLKS